MERCDDSNDVATELELKMPGSSVQQVNFKELNSVLAEMLVN